MPTWEQITNIFTENDLYDMAGQGAPMIPDQIDIKTQTEVRTVDPKTGAEKGSKEARFDLLPPEALWELASHYGRGARKYADRNWEKGYKWGLTVAALLRHLFQLIMGERYDQETGTHHAICVAWHAFALYTFDVRKIGTDDLTKLTDTPK